MIKNFKLSDDFKKRIVAGGLGLVLMTSTGALGVSIHNAKEIKKIIKQMPASSSTLVDTDIDYSKEKQQELSKEEQERLEQLNQTIDEYEKHREKLAQSGDKKLDLDELFLMKYQDNENTKYAIIKHWGRIVYTYYYPELTYLPFSNNDTEDFWNTIKLFKESNIGYSIREAYSGLNEEFYAVGNDEDLSFLPEEYIRYDEIVPLRLYLNSEESRKMVFSESGLDKIYLSDVDEIESRILAENEKYSKSLTK